MQIIHIVENLDSRYGGPAKSVPLLVKYLDILGIKNKIFTIKWWEDESNPILDEYDYDIQKFDLKGLKKINYAVGFEETLKKEITKDTIIHIHGLWTYPMYCAYKIAKKYNIPYIVATRGMLCEWCLEQNKFIKKLAFTFFIKDMLENATQLHLTAKQEDSELNAIGIKNQNRIIIPNGIEIDNKFDNIDEKLLKIINYEKNKFYIMFLGRISKKKGLHYLINSYKNIKEKYKKVEILVVGGIEDKEYFNSLENIDGVKFLGQLDGITKHTIFSISDLFVLPTHNENFGIVIAEAMSYKLPVITTTGTPWKEIKEKNAGWWVELSQENLDKALEEALNCSDECLAKKGNNGYNIIQNYTWDKQALKMKEIYNKILKGEK